MLVVRVKVMLVRLVVLVLVRVVQKPHVSSHIPEFLPAHSGQNRVSQGSLQPASNPMHVASQKDVGFRLTDSHTLKVDSVDVVVAVTERLVALESVMVSLAVERVDCVTEVEKVDSVVVVVNVLDVVAL